MVKWIVGGLLVAVVLVIALSFFLPKGIELSTTIGVDAPGDYVFDEIDDLQKWSSWSYLFSLDPDISITYGEKKYGLAATCEWTGQYSKGQLQLTQRHEDESITANLDLPDGPAVITFQVKEDSIGTLLTMSFELNGDEENLLARWKRLPRQYRIAAGLDYSVERLKEIAESKPRFSIEITEESLAPTYHIQASRTHSGEGREGVLAEIQSMDETLQSMLRQSSAQPEGDRFCFFKELSNGTRHIVLAVPVSPDARFSSSTPVLQHYSGDAIRGVHKGPYRSIDDTHSEVQRYISFRGYQPNGTPWEVFTGTPGTGDSGEGVVEVFYPVIRQ